MPLSKDEKTSHERQRHSETQRVLEGMDRNSVVLLHLLLITVHLYTAALDTVSVYRNVGEDAVLQCANVVYPNCSSTTWIYDKHSSAVTELVAHGKVRDAQRAERLRVGSDCSLHISAVHPEDAGLYTCQQYLYKGARQHGGDAPVLSPSSPMTELKPGSTVTLRCLLYTPEGPGQCNKDSAKTITLSWVDKRGTPQRSSRFEVENWPPCSSTLTVNLQQNDNRERRCQVTEGTDIKISQSYTIILSAIPSTSSSTASPPTSTLTAGITAGIVVGCVILCLAVAVVVIYMRRGTGDRPAANQDPGQSADHVTYSEINHSTRTTQLKEKDNDTAEEFTEYAIIKTAR
ncbi:hypothetical protein JZ751_010578 [Albula glossodonta]|uniref:Ig-like domain-containing protein n=1 Tax=Albula glossodonta TaxID=121402 RepID=A0A8T2P8C9_9TELE|nr:hypothetical protein JZ751_010578 [Albula glossodonta]